MNAREALGYVKTATIEDIKPGAVLWRVLGFKNCPPQRLQFLTGPVTIGVLAAHDEIWSFILSHESFEASIAIIRKERSTYGVHCAGYTHLKDNGIGADYNENRLFTTKEEAWKYYNLINS